MLTIYAYLNSFIQPTAIDSVKVNIASTYLHTGHLAEILSRSGKETFLCADRADTSGVPLLVFLRDEAPDTAAELVVSLLSYRGAAWYWEKLRADASPKTIFRLQRSPSSRTLGADLLAKNQRALINEIIELRKAIEEKKGLDNSNNQIINRLLKFANTSPTTLSGTKGFLESISNSNLEDLILKGKYFEIPYEKIGPELKKYISEYIELQSEHNEQKMETPFSVTIRSLSLPGDIYPYVSIGWEKAGYMSTLAGGFPDMQEREQLYRRWLGEGDTPSHPLEETQLPAEAPQRAKTLEEKLTERHSRQIHEVLHGNPGAATEDIPNARIFLRRLAQLHQNSGVNVLAHIPRALEEYDPGAPYGTTLGEYLQRLQKLQFHKKWHGDTLLLIHSSWMMYERASPPVRWSRIQPYWSAQEKTPDRPLPFPELLRAMRNIPAGEVEALAQDCKHHLTLSFIFSQYPLLHAFSRSPNLLAGALSDEGIALREIPPATIQEIQRRVALLKRLPTDPQGLEAAARLYLRGRRLRLEIAEDLKGETPWRSLTLVLEKPGQTPLRCFVGLWRPERPVFPAG